VFADEVPVSLLGVKLDCNATNIALGIGSSPFAGHGREAGEELGFLADPGENLGLGEAGESLVTVKTP